MRVRHVDFTKRGKEFKGIVGLADWEHDTIWIHNKLPKTNDGTRKAVENHERAHVWLDKRALESYLTKGQIEEFCDLVALFRTEDKWLSNIEIVAKKALLKGRTWRRDKRLIMGDILHWIGAEIKAKRMA